MKVIIVEANKAPEVKNIDGKLETMQCIVGGLIECLYLDNDIVAVINEEGKLMGLTPNRVVMNAKGEIYDIIMGTFFLCYAPANSEEFQSVPEGLIEKYVERFCKREVYFRG